jgi:hypothetical protein
MDAPMGSLVPFSIEAFSRATGTFNLSDRQFLTPLFPCVNFPYSPVFNLYAITSSSNKVRMVSVAALSYSVSQQYKINFWEDLHVKNEKTFHPVPFFSVSIDRKEDSIMYKKPKRKNTV